jgi:hypothetical protein
MGAQTKLLGRRTLVLAVALAAGVAIGAKAGQDATCAEGDGCSGVAEAPLQESNGNGPENVPVIQRVSKWVWQDGLEFQVIADSIWPMPARTGKSAPELQFPAGATPVRLQLRVTNHQKKDVRLLSLVGMPILQSADGKELKVHLFGNDHVGVPKRISLRAGETTTVKGSATLYTGGRYGTCLWWEDEFGTNWWTDGLKPGKYLLRLQHDTRWHARANSWVGKSGAWLGDVRTAAVPIEIVELKASPPSVCSGVEASSHSDGTWQFFKAAERGWKDDLEVVALAEPTWQAPAAGKQTQVCLGFRMATVEEWCVRILPGIAGVSIRSADGEEHPAKKTAATVSTDAPRLLGLRREYSDTVATPATLFRDGKTLTLAWVDRTGRLWHVENLKPGLYAVRYLIRAEQGDPNQDISYWVGELWTAAVAVEIKE